MNRHPRVFTLFPYPTPSRSAAGSTPALLDEPLDRLGAAVVADDVEAGLDQVAGHRPTHDAEADRSEEHTSELQSRQYLVCRLLLEKKKRTILTTCQTQLLR